MSLNPFKEDYPTVDDLFAYLRGNGRTGALNDMLFQEGVARGLTGALADMISELSGGLTGWVTADTGTGALTITTSLVSPSSPTVSSPEVEYILFGTATETVGPVLSMSIGAVDGSGDYPVTLGITEDNPPVRVKVTMALTSLGTITDVLARDGLAGDGSAAAYTGEISDAQDATTYPLDFGTLDAGTYTVAAVGFDKFGNMGAVVTDTVVIASGAYDPVTDLGADLRAMFIPNDADFGGVGDGNQVSSWTDSLTGSGRSFDQASVPLQPISSTTHLTFSGAGNLLNMDAALANDLSNATVFMRVRTADTKYVLMGTNSGSKYIGASESGSGNTTTSTGVGSPVFEVDGTTPTINDRDDLNVALGGDVWRSVIITGVDMTAIDPNVIRLGGYDTSQFRLDGDIAFVAFTAALTTQQMADMRTYMSQYGV